MKETNKENKQRSGVLKSIVLILFDILAVNASYYLAILIRFFVNGQFYDCIDSVFLPALFSFCPWYTVACILIFAAYHLYNSDLGHAGLHDLNRVLMANVCTAVVMVVGSMICFHFTAPIWRLPITVYFIGAVLQFLLIFASRFLYRFLILEKTRLGNKGINTMIVGNGELAHMLRRQMDSNNLAKLVVILDDTGRGGSLADGVPVVSDIKKLEEYVKKYSVQTVVLADSLMSSEDREWIKSNCPVEVQDFSGYQPGGFGLSAASVLAAVVGSVSVNGKQYENAEKALMEIEAGSTVKSIEGATIVTEKKTQVLDTSWAGSEDLSFF